MKTTPAFQEALGSVLGSIFGGLWSLFWLHFRFEVGAPCKDVKNAKIAVSPRRESNFQGSGALKNGQQMLENRLSKRSLLQERLEERLGVDVGELVGGGLGEFTFGKRWVRREVTRAATNRSRSRPSVEPKGSVAGFKGLRPPVAGPPYYIRRLEGHRSTGLGASF